MNKLPEQKVLIRKLREAYQSKGLSLNKVLEMMPEDDRKIGKTTCQRLFNRTDAENLNFDFNTLILLSELLLDADEEDDEILLKYKKKIIERLEEKIAERDHVILFRSDRIKNLEETVSDLRRQNGILTEMLKRQMDRCDNCQFHNKE